MDYRALVKSVRKEWNDFWRRVRGGSWLDIAILASAAALCIVLIVIAGCSLAGCMDGGRGSAVVSVPSAVEVADSDYDKDAASINETEFDGTILIETDDAGEDYIDETLFIGDSNTVRMVNMGYASLDNTLAAVSMGIQDVTGSACMNFQGYGYIKVPRAVKLMQPKRIIITYGTNNAYETAGTFIQWYDAALDAIEAEWPYADIIINAVPPVAKTRSYPAITMKTIDEFNLRLAQLAKERGCLFLNSSEALKGADGYAKSGYMEDDGIHLTEQGMEAYLEYVRTHAYETQDRRPKPLEDVPTHYATPETFFNPPAPEPASSSSSSSSSQGECTEHDWKETSRVEPNYCQDGKIVYTCSKCGATKEEAIEATQGHMWLNDGNTASHECQICHYIGVHEFAETQRTQATCTTAGSVTYTCKVCGYKKTESLPATGQHTWGATDPNTGTRTCTVCGTSQTDPSWTPPASTTPTPPASSTTPPPASSSTPAPPPAASSTPPPASSQTPPAETPPAETPVVESTPTAQTEGTSPAA